MKLVYTDLDWKALLIKRYKNYGLNENSVSLLLCLDEILKEGPKLVTAEDFEWMMTIKKNEIDNILATLMTRKFIALETVGKKTFTTMRPLVEKILDDTQKDILIENDNEKKNESKEQGQKIYSYFENMLGRSLSAIEFDRICTWFKEGATEGMIKEAVERVKSKTPRVTIRAVDKMILSLEKSADIKNEGYSPRSDDWRIGVDDTIDIIKHKWIPTDDN